MRELSERLYLTRREFLKAVGIGAAAGTAGLSGCLDYIKPKTPKPAETPSPEELRREEMFKYLANKVGEDNAKRLFSRSPYDYASEYSPESRTPRFVNDFVNNLTKEFIDNRIEQWDGIWFVDSPGGSLSYRATTIEKLKKYKEDNPDGYNYIKSNVDIIVDMNEKKYGLMEMTGYRMIWVEETDPVCSGITHITAHEVQSQLAKKGIREPVGYRTEFYPTDKEADCEKFYGKEKVDYIFSRYTRDYKLRITKEEIEQLLNSPEYQEWKRQAG